MKFIKTQLRRFWKGILVFLVGGVAIASTIGGADLPVIVEVPSTIEQELVGKTSKEKANIKGQEIANIDFRGQHISAKYGVRIEITGIEKIEGGVQVFARAWKDGKQLGFGKDGTVDIERFKIFNPPVLVDDPNGTIIRSGGIDGISGIKSPDRKLRYDPKEAIVSTLEHTIGLVGKEGTNIISGKVGNTTSTFFPDAHVESTSVDGPISYDTDSGGTWNEAHDAATGGGTIGGAFPSLALSSGTENGIGVYNHPNGRHIIGRAFNLFDSSALPDTDTIDGAIFSIYVNSTQDDDNDSNAFISVVDSTPASDTDLVVADYDQCGDAIDNPTEGVASGQRKDITTISSSAYLDFTLNSTGEGWISKTGITKLGIREGHDIVDDPPTNNDGNMHSRVLPYWADQTGTANDPKLVVEHTAVAVGEEEEYIIIFE